MNDLTRILTEQPELVDAISGQIYGQGIGGLIVVLVTFIAYMIFFINVVRSAKRGVLAIPLLYVSVLYLIVMAAVVPDIMGKICSPKAAALEQIYTEGFQVKRAQLQ